MEKITFKPVETSHPNLPNVIYPSIGMATDQKINSILMSYNTIHHHLIGAFTDIP